jgi:hypothetical protein
VATEWDRHFDFDATTDDKKFVQKLVQANFDIFLQILPLFLQVLPLFDKFCYSSTSFATFIQVLPLI